MKLKKCFIVMMLMFLILGACSNNNSKSDAKTEEDLDNLTDSGLPIVEEPIELNIFAGKAPATADDWNDVLIWNEYEKMTNIDVNWDMVPHEGLSEKRNLALASGDLPDAFHSAVIPVPDIFKYGQQGTFIPLNDLIEEHAPNLKKILEAYPEVKKAITFPDGNIYSFPLIYDPEFAALRISEGPWIREDWLEALDMDMPETTDEFYEYLKAVKEGNPSGDESMEEVPFGAQSINGLLTYLKGSFGIGNKGKGHNFIDLDPDGETVRFYPASENYKEMLEYVHKLYDEGLIEENIFSISHEQFYANAGEGLYGSTYNHSPAELFPGEYKDNYTGGVALEGPHGEKEFTGISFPSSTTGFVITSQNEHPAATARWMDHFYSDEGAELFFMGIEGETFTKTEDGEYEYVEDIRDNPDGLTLDQGVAQYLTWPGGQYPGILMEDYFKGAEGTETSKEAAEKLKPDFIEEVWPSFTYTEEENNTMSSVGADIEKYVTEMTDQFISGQTSLSEWDNYVETLENMGLDQYLEIQQDAYERYLSN